MSSREIFMITFETSCTQPENFCCRKKPNTNFTFFLMLREDPVAERLRANSPNFEYTELCSPEFGNLPACAQKDLEIGQGELLMIHLLVQFTITKSFPVNDKQ